MAVLRLDLQKKKYGCHTAAILIPKALIKKNHKGRYAVMKKSD